MILLDTHVWWWSLVEPERLSNEVVAIIRGAKTDERFIASISIWEFAMMVAKKRIDLKSSPARWLSRAIDISGITLIDLSPDIAVDACNLPGSFHEDPTDRIIVASARVHNLELLTRDRKILAYTHVRSIW